jgi:molybdopterin-guanine dinucleotide biosynthesis protein A
VILVTQTPELYQDLSVHTVEDIIQGMGPLGGIHAGLLAAKSRYAFVIACDMPGMQKSYIDYMKENLAHSDFDACVTRFGDWIEPFHAFYSKAQIHDLETFLSTGRKSVHRFLEGQKTLYIPEPQARAFSPDWGMFYNLNTREDLAHYMARTRETS